MITEPGAARASDSYQGRRTARGSRDRTLLILDTSDIAKAMDYLLKRWPAILPGASTSCRPGTGKAKAMPKLHDLEADIEALDEVLMSDQFPPDCLMLCDLDGFLTGIAIGLELIMPGVWLPVICGGEEPVFDDAGQHNRLLDTGADVGFKVMTALEAIEVVGGMGAISVVGAVGGRQ